MAKNSNTPTAPGSNWSLAKDGSWSCAKLPVFRAGNYGAKGDWPVSRLNEVVAAYDPKLHEAPVTVDHKQEGRAWGWTAKPLMEGDTLNVSLSRVPSEFKELIEQGAFKKRSIELYSSLADAGGKPYLKAVSFLGAAAPHVKGMDDPAFAESNQLHFKAEEPCEQIEFRDSEIDVADIMDPNPAGHGALVSQRATDGNLEHFHNAYQDQAGSGFTSPALTNCYPAEVADDHQHEILNGIVQEAATTTGIMHSHPLYWQPAMMGEGKEPPAQTAPTGKTPGKKKSTSAAAQTEEEDPAMSEAIIKEFEAKFAESENKRIAAEARILKMEDDRRNEKFNAFFDGVVASGKLTPAIRDKAKIFYDRQSADSAVVKFGESEIPAGDAFLRFVEEVAAAGALAKAVTTQVGTPSAATNGRTGFTEAGKTVPSQADLRKKAHEYAEKMAEGTDKDKSEFMEAGYRKATSEFGIDMLAAN